MMNLESAERKNDNIYLPIATIPWFFYLHIMIITFGNQKGGAGKSTLAILCANWLSIIRKKKVVVLDMDYQQSIFAKYQESQKLENPQPYEVIPVSLDQFPALKDTLQSDPDQIVIIDLPGKLDDDNLMPVIQAADVIVIPFKYERMTFESTVLFTMLAETLNPLASFLFIPNMIQRSVNYELKENVNVTLGGYGKVTPNIYQSVKYERILTKDLPTEKLDEIEAVFNFLEL